MNDVKWMNTNTVDFKGIKKTKNSTPDRSPFLRDFGSIIYRSQFRRQSFKTQVFLNPEFDFPRTRLTHAIEVEQIGRQLTRYFCELLTKKIDGISSNFDRNLEDLVASSCLAHDIGQAPFGHKGEKVLASLMSEKVPSQANNSFEANKQNIRLLLGSISRLPYGVTCALVDATAKYKAEKFKAESEKHPGYYASEKDVVEEIFRENGTNHFRHPACYIMEASDDIAYISGDLQDGLKLGLISFNQAKDTILTNITRYDASFNVEHINWGDILTKAFDSQDFSKPLTYMLRALVKSTRDNIEKFVSSLDNNTDINILPSKMNKYFSEHSKDLNVVYAHDGIMFRTIKKKIYKDNLLKDSEIARNEILAKKVIQDLWSVAVDELIESDVDRYKKSEIYMILPSHVREHIDAARNNQDYENQKYHILSDFISGMTDRFAIELWRKIFDPSTLGHS